MKFLFIIDPIERLDPGHDTSVALMEAAQMAGHEVWITQAEWLGVEMGQAMGRMRAAQLKPVTLKDDHWVADRDWFNVGDVVYQPLGNMQVVMMRTDPPVTIPYLYTTYILDYIDSSTTLVLNSPQGLRAANEKMYALQFTDAIPETIVSRDKAVIQKTVERWGRAVLKPLGGKAGEGILFLEQGDRNLNIATFSRLFPLLNQFWGSCDDALIGLASFQFH